MSKIVLCDDEADILDTTAELLRVYGHEVTPVQHAHDILDVVRRERPALLLQDWGMPGLDLERLVADLRADARLEGLAILLFTGSVNAQAMAQKLHVQGFVEKPFDIEALQKRIVAVLGKKAAASGPVDKA